MNRRRQPQAAQARRSALGALVALALVIVALPPTTAAASSGPPLGKRSSFGKYGDGWGKPHPGRLYLGGVPSGLAYKINWSSWGKRMAYGRGWSPQYSPRGGYYRKSVRAQFRATDLGTCSGDNTRRYRRILVRKQARPRGPWEPWGSWSLNLCAGFSWEPPTYDSCAPTETEDADRIIDRVSYLDLKCSQALEIIDASPWPYLATDGSAEYDDKVYTHNGFECSGYASNVWDGDDETGERQALWSCTNPRDGAYLSYRQR